MPERTLTGIPTTATPQDWTLEARRLDDADTQGDLRDRFVLPEGCIYLDGNSLGALPRATQTRVKATIAAEWGRDLITSWNRHDWIGQPLALGARIARLIGAADDEVLATDTTSANLFKLIAAACEARPGRRTILTRSHDFPTDVYMARSVTRLLGDRTVACVDIDDISDAIDSDTALVMLTHVHYTSGRMLDMAAITRAAHAAGALVLWDLSHSAGAVPVALDACHVDLAVGCGYKYLNGGPGAPAFLFVARHLQETLQSPLSGWLGHAAPFDFDDAYRPAPGIARFQCGTPSVIGMAALACGVAQFDGVDLPALFGKGAALGAFAIRRMRGLCDAHGFRLASPSDDAARGSHVAFAHEHAYAICQALIAHGVIGDFRTPDLLRLGFAPLYTRFGDVDCAISILARIMEAREWDRPEFHARGRVT